MGDMDTSSHFGSDSDAYRLYSDLLAKATTPRKKRSLEIVWQALNQLHSEDCREYTIASVGRRAASLGGLREQSLRNKGAEDYRDLITSFAASSGRPQSAKTRPAPSQVEEAISKIADPAVRTILRMTLEEARRLRHQNQTLRAAFRELCVDAEASRGPCAGAATQIQSRVVEGEVLEPALSIDRLGASKTDSLRLFLSDSWLAERGLRLEPDGSIVEETADNFIVAPPDFADALRDVIRLSEPKAV